MIARIFIGVVITGTFYLSWAIATMPDIPSLKMDISIIHDGNWEAGKETQVTFKFKPLQEVPHKTQHPDEARLEIDSGLVLVSGSPNWSGFLEKGKEYSISVVLKPAYVGKFGLGIIIRSCLLRVHTDEEIRKMEEEYDKLMEQSPELWKQGFRGKGAFPKKKFYYLNGTGTVVEVRGEIPPPDSAWLEIDGVKWRYPTSRPKSIIPVDSILKLMGNPTLNLKLEVIKDSSKILDPPRPK